MLAYCAIDGDPLMSRSTWIRIVVLTTLLVAAAVLLYRSLVRQSGPGQETDGEGHQRSGLPRKLRRGTGDIVVDVAGVHYRIKRNDLTTNGFIAPVTCGNCDDLIHTSDPHVHG